MGEGAMRKQGSGLKVSGFLAILLSLALLPLLAFAPGSDASRKSATSGNNVASGHSTAEAQKAKAAGAFDRASLTFHLPMRGENRYNFVARGDGLAVYAGKGGVVTYDFAARDAGDSAAADKFRGSVASGAGPEASAAGTPGTGTPSVATPGARALGARLHGVAVSVAPVGGRDVAPSLSGKRGAQVSYFVGNKRSHRSSRSGSQVKYEGIYPGIDMSYQVSQSRVKYEFRVAAGADPSAIVLKYSGQDDLSIARDGSLILSTPYGTLRDDAPYAYQASGAGKKVRKVTVPARYVLDGDVVRIAVGAYDTSRPLVVDPGLTASTFLGGQGNDAGRAITVASDGSIYVAGDTVSSDFPATLGAYVTSRYGNDEDLFVSKLSADLSTLSASTFVGGSDFDIPTGIAIGTGANVYVAGYTRSNDFPTTFGAYDPVSTGTNAFVIRLSSTLSTLSASTYLGGTGGSGEDYAEAMAIASDGTVFVTGTARSSDFPTTPGAYDQTRTPDYYDVDVFVSRLSADLASLNASTILGGGGGYYDEVKTLALGSDNSAYVAGYTNSASFPVTPGAYDPAYSGYDAFVSHLSADLTTLSASTYLGGADVNDTAHSIAVGADGSVYVAGETSSEAFPTTAGAYDRIFGIIGASVGPDGFVSRLSGNLGTLMASTLIGGSVADRLYSIAVASNGSVFIGGSTQSLDFPTTSGAYDRVKGSDGLDYDAFVSRLPANLGSLSASTFVGGGQSEFFRDLALSPLGGAPYVTGYTYSTAFPTTVGSFDPSHNDVSSTYGDHDAFISTFNLDLGTPAVTNLTITQSGSSTKPTEGGATDSYTVKLTSEPTANVTVGLSAPDGQISLSKTTLTFTPANWATGQTVTVTAINDSRDEASPMNARVIHNPASSDTRYNALANMTLTTQVIDNDVTGISISQSSGSTRVKEGGSTDYYYVKLRSKPSGDVIIAVSAGSQLYLYKKKLTFTTSNWASWQKVTVKAVNDSANETSPMSARITHNPSSSSDSRYNALANKVLTVYVIDND